MGVNMEDFTISDLAQAVVLGLGAISALLLVLWQSRCLCRCRLGISDQCYIFDCSREPPPLINDDTDGKDKGKDKDKDKDKNKKPKDDEKIDLIPASPNVKTNIEDVM
tara:strand:+ start:1553 stop:1876 length:324 start_codon:yes stop_codon:yes gene_type:complete